MQATGELQLDPPLQPEPVRGGFFCDEPVSLKGIQPSWYRRGSVHPAGEARVCLVLQWGRPEYVLCFLSGLEASSSQGGSCCSSSCFPAKGEDPAVQSTCSGQLPHSPVASAAVCAPAETGALLPHRTYKCISRRGWAKLWLPWLWYWRPKVVRLAPPQDQR